ncbi:CD63 antigen [Frankliniella fusca]|uniref:Tetraspanin n=1 Tax=Frankliniella fusca TaxID=407009 RepID=A0AAE1I0Y1_9NEOP|nr:CD63 antigen [Frankliniella fusca]
MACESCGMTCIKYLLFAFNLIFAISGITILALGGTILASQNNVQLITENYWSAAAILIVAGFIVFLISFLGCCGAIRGSNVMVMSFAVLLIIIFVLELTAAVTAYVLRADVHDMVESGLNKTIQSYNNDTQYREGWNILQHDFACCGVNGPKDWEPVLGGNKLPDVCCPEKDVSDTCTISTQHYSDGCLKKFESLLENKAVVAGSIALSVCLIQIIGVILACCLGRSLRKDYETV